MALMNTVHSDVLILADLLCAEWPAVRERIRLSGHPTCEGDDAEPPDEAGVEPDADPKDEQDDDADDGNAESATTAKNIEDYRRELRESDRVRRREAAKKDKELAELRARLKKREDADKSEQEKAIEAAREEAAAEVTTKYEAQQRSDRIENAVTKLSLKGFKAKDKDGNEVTLRFADPDDAQLRLERALRNEDLTYDDIYSGGKVNTEAVMGFLTELLEEHPRLRAEENSGGKKDPPPDFDGGKGKGGGSKSLEEMTPDDHLKDLEANAK